MILNKKIKNTKGQIADVLMFIIFISFVIYFILSYTSMQSFFRVQSIVDGIVRNEVEIIRTKGILKTDEYKNFLSKIGKYGNFEAHLTVEKQDNAGNLIKWFTPETILDQPLKVGDFVKIMVESRDRSLFSELMIRNFMFGLNSDRGSGFKMQSLCSGMVCSDGYIRGLEAINIIERYRKQCTVEVTTKDKTQTPPVDYPSTQYDASNPYDPDTAPTETVIEYDSRFIMEINRDKVTYSIADGTDPVTGAFIPGIRISELNNQNLR